MQRERLTPDRIRRFTCPADTKQAFLWDSVAPRLAVRATAGTKSFIFEAKLNRQTIRRTIGDASAWTVEDARAEANRLQTLIDQGKDPREMDREQAEAKIAAKAREEAAKLEAARLALSALDAWQAYVAARKPKWGHLSLRDHERVSTAGGAPLTRGRRPGMGDTTQPGALHALLLRPLAQIDAATVETWIKGEAARRPTHAALAYRLLRGFLNWAAERPEYAGVVHPDACKAKAVREEVPARRAKDDCLQREQLGSWFARVRQIHNPVQAAYLQALLLTGARPGELVGVQWEDVDFQWKALTIRDKVEGERTIPLTPCVAALLAALPRRNEWVFSSPTAASGRLQEPRISHSKALAAAGLPNLTLHGLRRSFGTLAEWVECPAGISAQIMGHKPSATAEKHYRVRPLDLLRMWHTKIEGWILEQAGVEQPQEGGKGLRAVR